MAATRYLRMIGVSAQGGSYLELTAVVFAGSGGAVVPVSTSCSHSPVVGAIEHLTDGDPATFARFAGADISAAGFYVEWDFGSVVDISAVSFGGGATADLYIGNCTLLVLTAGRWEVLVSGWAGDYPGAGVIGPVLGSFNAGLLLHFDDLTDSSGGGKSVSLTGGASISTVESFFGGKSFFVNSLNGAATVPSHADWDFGVADFLVDFRFFINAPISGLNRCIVCRDNIGGTRGWLIFLSDGDDAPFGSLSGVAWSSAGGVFSRCMWPIVPQPDTWYRSSYRRVNGVFELWVNETLVAVDAGNQSLVVGASATPLLVGNLCFSGTPANGPLNGYVDELLIDKGPRAAAFNPSLPRPMPYDIDAGPVRSRGSIASVVASSPVLPHSADASLRSVFACDVEHGGPGTIYGTTKTKGTPNLPTKARVVLQHQRSKLPVRETWSDPVTGAFVFTGIDTSQQFLALAEDAEGHFRPVAANRLTPEVL